MKAVRRLRETQPPTLEGEVVGGVDRERHRQGKEKGPRHRADRGQEADDGKGEESGDR